MSRNCQLFQAGENGFEIKDIKGYKKWKDSLEDDFSDLLHEEQGKRELTVYVGIKWKDTKDLDDLDTYINYFHPDGDGWDSGTPAEFWCGLSLFVKEPIELLQTDEEFPYLTKPFGGENKVDEGMYRLFAFEGKVTVQYLGFRIISTNKYNAKDLIPEEIMDYVQDTKDSFCDKCKEGFNPVKFNFKDRGYYEEVHRKAKFNRLCQKCYNELKKPFAEARRIERDIMEKQEELKKLRGEVTLFLPRLK